jgi:hypothetical protein
MCASSTSAHHLWINIYALDFLCFSFCVLCTFRQQLSSESRGSALDILHSLVLTALREHIPTNKLSALQAQIKAIVKALCGIGSNLSLSRECR